MKKVLLTTVTKPFPPLDGVNSFDLYASRLTKYQDIFTVSSYYPALPLFLIGQNLQAEAVVLEHPTVAQFERELARGYDYIGIHFAASFFFDKVLAMVRTIRRLSPGTKIVLGGYGVTCLTQEFAQEKELAGLVDYVCQEEGVCFMRKVMGEPVDRPIKQVFPAARVNFMGQRFLFDNMLAALGCRAGCEFCATSAFFKYRKIRVATPAELWTHLKRNIREKDVAFNWIYDEDFFADPDYVREFAALIRKDPDFDLKKVCWGGYGSVRTLSRFTAEELAGMGVTSLWIGVESKFSELPKRQGRDIKETFDSFRKAGIQIVGSFIIGWDFHTPENVREDIDFLTSLNPTFCQVSSLMPCPGTKFWDKVVQEGRLKADEFRWDHFHLYSSIHKHRNLDEREIPGLMKLTHRSLLEHNGPSVYRLFEVHLKGYASFKDSPDPQLQRRAEMHREWCFRAYPILFTSKVYTPGGRLAPRVEALYREYLELMGKPTLGQRCQAVFFFLYATILKVRSFFPRHVPQPVCHRYVYTGGEA